MNETARGFAEEIRVFLDPFNLLNDAVQMFRRAETLQGKPLFAPRFGGMKDSFGQERSKTILAQWLEKAVCGFV